MAQDPLNPANIASIIDASADILISPLEAVSAFCHACMLATGFRFLGFGEDHKAGMQSCDSISPFTEFVFDESQIRKLWTADSPLHREFRYAHSQSSLEFI